CISGTLTAGNILQSQSLSNKPPMLPITSSSSAKSTTTLAGTTSHLSPVGASASTSSHGNNKLLTGADLAALLKRYLNAVSTRLKNTTSTGGSGTSSGITSSSSGNYNSGAPTRDINTSTYNNQVSLSEVIPTHKELLTQLAGERCIKGALEYFGGCISRDIVLPSEHFEEEVFSILENAREFLIQNLEQNSISIESGDMEKYLSIFDKKVGNKFETKFLPLGTSSAGGTVNHNHLRAGGSGGGSAAHHHPYKGGGLSRQNTKGSTAGAAGSSISLKTPKHQDRATGGSRNGGVDSSRSNSMVVQEQDEHNSSEVVGRGGADAVVPSVAQEQQSAHGTPSLTLM
ncbi:unnamed protein product, partial [Amoebophrya sp. A120]